MTTTTNQKRSRAANAPMRTEAGVAALSRWKQKDASSAYLSKRANASRMTGRREKKPSLDSDVVCLGDRQESCLQQHPNKRPKHVSTASNSGYNMTTATLHKNQPQHSGGVARIGDNGVQYTLTSDEQMRLMRAEQARRWRRHRGKGYDTPSFQVKNADADRREREGSLDEKKDGGKRIEGRVADVHAHVFIRTLMTALHVSQLGHGDNYMLYNQVKEAREKQAQRWKANRKTKTMTLNDLKVCHQCVLGNKQQ